MRAGAGVAVGVGEATGMGRLVARHSGETPGGRTAVRPRLPPGRTEGLRLCELETELERVDDDRATSAKLLIRPSVGGAPGSRGSLVEVGGDEHRL